MGMSPLSRCRLMAYLATNISKILDITVSYRRGPAVSGFISHISFDPEIVILCRNTCPRGDDPEVSLDFTQAAEVDVELYDGSSMCFKIGEMAETLGT